MDNRIEGVTFTLLQEISTPSGNVLHGMKRSEATFSRFGEAYFSCIDHGAIKGWKKHAIMQMNLIVVTGSIRFVVYDDRENSNTKGMFFSITMSRKENYGRLTLEPGLWLAFKGLSDNNMLLNLASDEHDPQESISKNISDISYEW